MKEKIAETAGKIWKLLRDKDEISIAQLPKTIKDKEVIIYQALGWLAREDKIVYRVKGTKTFVSLTETERSV
jgi:hypothetical protein